MKGFKKIAILQAACLLMTGGAAAFPLSPVPAMTVTAADYEEESYGDFTIHKYETYVEIAKYNGTDTEITVPDMIDGLPVLSIGQSAFYADTFFTTSNNAKIVSITLPKTLLNIGYNAFYGCKALKSIVIPNSVTEIGFNAFRSCSSLESVQLSKKLKNLASDVFNNCTSLNAINIPDSVTTIGSGAFENCSVLTAISIPKNAELSARVFNGCTALKDVTIPDDCKLYTYGNAVFAGCKSLETMKLPEGFGKVGTNMFDGCTSLKEITIPDSYQAIEDNAFADCSALTKVVIPENIQSVGLNAFSNCARLEKITFLNPYCLIRGYQSTICNYTLNGTSYYNGVICGYEDSSAQDFAEKFDLEFESLGEIPTTTTTTVTTTAPVTTTTVTTTTAPVTTKATITTEATKPVTTAPVTTTTKRITTYALTHPPKVTLYPSVTTTVQTTTTKPEPTIHDLNIKISLTPPTRTEYELGETVDYTGAYFSYTITLPGGNGMGQSPMNLSGIKESLYQEALDAHIGRNPEYVFPLMLIVDRTKVNINSTGVYPVTVSITDQTGSTVLAQESFNIKIGGTAQTVPAVTTTAAVPVTTKVITTTQAPVTTMTTATTQTPSTTTTKPAVSEKDLKVKIELVPPTKTEYYVGKKVDYAGGKYRFTAEYTAIKIYNTAGRPFVLMDSMDETVRTEGYYLTFGMNDEYEFPVVLTVDISKVNTYAAGVYPVTATVTTKDGSYVYAKESYNITVKEKVMTTVKEPGVITTTTKAAITTSTPVTTKSVATTTKPLTTVPAATTAPAAATTPATTTTMPATAVPPTTTAPAVTTTPAATTTAPVTTTTTPDPKYITGDMNGDGLVSVEDAQLTLKAYTEVHVAGLESKLTAQQKKAADVNGDGDVTVEDAQLILKYYTANTVAGKDTTWEELLKK